MNNCGNKLNPTGDKNTTKILKQRPHTFVTGNNFSPYSARENVCGILPIGRRVHDGVRD